MITLITGVPGSSKTLNTIHEVLTVDAYKNRPVFYHNIPEVTLEWNQLSDDEARNWFNLPHGSVVILDECQRLFRPMKYGDKVPKHVEELETHRHLGIDIFIISQHPKLLDTKVRRLVGRHLHFKRQFGMESATRIEFQKVADDPDDYFAQKESIKKRVRFPKDLYGVYKSAEEHTHKKTIPKKLYFIALVAILSLFLIWKAVTSFGQTDDAQPTVASINPIVNQVTSLTSEPQKTDPVMTWAERRQPRVPDIPSSAPVYDDLTAAKTFPRPQCILRVETNHCTCFTQQATPLSLSPKQCKRIVANGYFDPTKSDHARADGKSGGNGEASADSGSDSPHERTLKALKIRREIHIIKNT